MQPKRERRGTPIIRKYLQFIRKRWASSSERAPFMFTQDLPKLERAETLTIEEFAVEFVMRKYA